MLKNIVAKRYAKAFFNLIYAPSSSDPSFLKALDLAKDISETIPANPVFKNILFNPSYGMETRKAVLLKVVDSQVKREIPSLAVKFTKNFFSLLVKKNKLVYLPEIIVEIQSLRAGLAKTTPLVLTVPVALSAGQINTFTKKFENILQRPISLTVKTSPEILGGMTMQIGSQVFDATLQMKLAHLKGSLTG
ncbi:MAG: ATP synthase F1 subunit delta [Nitrospirae bacterium]|nr:ATP synthase F1 subunit delta [Nitrospirota bacterium]MBI3352901.1 ATP synthase F1 subunit delta [Nitrospirota bacterium]